jgi:DNA-binding PadR family transcriptional regulator
MLLDEHRVAACLDAKWRTVASIRSRLGIATDYIGQLVATLDRLAEKGLIERSQRDTGAPRLGRKRGHFTVSFYRRTASTLTSEIEVDRDENLVASAVRGGLVLDDPDHPP